MFCDNYNEFCNLCVETNVSLLGFVFWVETTARSRLCFKFTSSFVFVCSYHIVDIRNKMDVKGNVYSAQTVEQHWFNILLSLNLLF